MLLKIVDCHPPTLFDNIESINRGLKDESNDVVRNLSKIVEFLAYKDPIRVSSSIPYVVNLLDHEDSQLRFTASLIFKAISRKHDKFVAIPKLVKLLDDEDKRTQLNAINELLNLTDEYIDKMVSLLYQRLQNKTEQAEISELIFKISSKYPENSVKALIKHLVSKNDEIRRFTIIYLNNLAGKNLDSLIPAIPKLCLILKDKDPKIRMLAGKLLLKISQDHGIEFKNNVNELQLLFKKVKGKLQLNVAAILINIMKYYPEIKILPELNKRMEKFVKSSDIKISKLARQNLAIILKWKDDYGPAIKICQDLIKEHPLEENIELSHQIAQIYHVIGDFKNAIRYFLDASKPSEHSYIRLISFIMIAYDQILLNLHSEAANFLNKTKNSFERLSEQLSAKQKRVLGLMVSYVDALMKFDFEEARNFLTNIIESNKYLHKWEKRAQENEFRNLEDLQRHHEQLIKKK